MSLSVILPAYNDQANLERHVPGAVESLRQMVGRFELIIIDDASQDGTAAAADRLADAHPEIRVVRNSENLRQGGCLRRGFELAELEWVTHNAADYPFRYRDLPVLLEHLPEADIVVAARKSYPGISVARKFVSLVNRALLHVLFGVPVRDFNFIQIYRREVLRAHSGFSEATSFITPEKVIRAYRAGLRVVEVEVEYHQRLTGRPSSATVENVQRALVDMARLWRELRREQRGA